MKRITKVKTLEDGRALLNVGCGTRTHCEWNNIDRSPYARLVHHMSLARFLRRVGILSPKRYENLRFTDLQIICWDVRQGLPFDDNAFDAVYHSHFLGHIDRVQVPYIMSECHRVLKNGGTIRIVVPDLEQLVRRYCDATAALRLGERGAAEDYEETVFDIFELMVRRAPEGTSEQPPLVRMLERVVRGDTMDQGEARRWHYDEYSLSRLLQEAGFGEIQRVDAVTSRIEGWARFALDINEDGTVYKPCSLYMEAVKQPTARR